ncbi:SDR family NAD(P)-dependent oxidoreductase [Streptomyces sp. NPDC058279]|uniref:SDR family NAD(P)-dependent oxidoreductase n=1 Tax=Streptomyces sp. NPDC058279 TaxID=3346418 RepID=UPI0036EC5B97
MTLSNQVAIVTGGGRGIGRQIALSLVEAGARVAILARNAAELEETAELAGDKRSHLLVAPADINDAVAVGQVVKQVNEHFGPVSLLVNNAAVYTPGEPLFWEADLDAWWNDVHVNVLGTLTVTHAVLPTMVAQGRGSVITVGSDSGVMAYPVTSYSFGKSSLVRFTETLDLSLEKSAPGVKAFMISPGSVRTRQTDAFAVKYPDMQWTPVEYSGRLVTDLATGRYDELRGRYLTVFDDLDGLLGKLDEVRKEEVRVQRMRTYAPDGAIVTDWA